MDRLLDFYGKEHSVIKLADAQALAVSLAGGELTILHADVSSASAPRSALTSSAAMGQGVFTPDGEVICETLGKKAGGRVANSENHQIEKKSVKPSRKFTGKLTGKAELK